VDAAKLSRIEQPDCNNSYAGDCPRPAADAGLSSIYSFIYSSSTHHQLIRGLRFAAPDSTANRA
jgi:hypothetical protein